MAEVGLVTKLYAELSLDRVELNEVEFKSNNEHLPVRLILEVPTWEKFHKPREIQIDVWTRY